MTLRTRLVIVAASAVAASAQPATLTPPAAMRLEGVPPIAALRASRSCTGAPVINRVPGGNSPAVTAHE